MATIKDVAQRAHVSIATVSYVLNGTGAVSEQKRRAVLDAVAALNYQPSYRGRALQAQRSMTLAAGLPSGMPTDARFGPLLAGLADGAAQQGYHVLLVANSSSQGATAATIDLYRSGRVDGMVLLDVEVDDARIADLKAAATPYICAGHADMHSSYVAIDGAAGMLEAMAHLIVRGHERIALLQPPLEHTLAAEQETGYRDALVEAGLPFAPEFVIEGGSSEEQGYAATQELLALPQPPTAIVAGSGALTFGALHAMHDAYVAVGTDVALVSFEDTPAAAHTAPPLTAVRQPVRAWGVQLAQGLVRIIEEQATVQTVLQPQLIVRHSCGE
jgi:LacI family transcriptional regulator/LacI family repressor for deo operon, udp, cdd, tsx, nupC, and nupG